MNDDFFIKESIKEAKKAYKKNEIPVGAVIVLNDGIIAKGHNLRDSKNIITKHAEIIAIEKANKVLNNWRLVDCTLYSSLEPCEMCSAVIKAAKIKRVVYAAKSPEGKSEFIQIDNPSLINKSESLIKTAFINIRNKNVSRETIE